MKEISSKLKAIFGIFLGVAITVFFQSRWWFEIGLKMFEICLVSPWMVMYADGDVVM